MRKRTVESVIQDSFVDYEGKTHQFTVAAVSEILPQSVEEFREKTNCDDYDEVDDDIKMIHCVCSMPDPDDLDYDSIEISEMNDLPKLVKVVRIGVAICNPNDPYKENIGPLIASNRAAKSNAALYSTKAGMINTQMVNALLRQEAEYIKNNPGSYIKGYTEAARAYATKKKQ